MRSLRKFILPALALVVSLFGAWMVSSVMAFLKMPTPLVVLSALLMLPIGLFLWEVYEQRRLGWRYIRKYKIPIILSDIAPKVLILNLSFIVILLLLNASNAFNQPNFVFKALKKNGDWMLANYRGKEVKPLRDALQKTAGNLEKIAGSPAKAKQPVAKAPSAKPSSAPPPESTQPAPSQNDVAEAYYKQGEDALNQCNYDDALANLNKAIELNSGLATAYSNRGFLYYHQGNYQEALADLNRAIELEPNLAYVYAGRGIVYTKYGSFQKALSDLEKAIQLDSQLDGAYNSLGLGILLSR